MHAAKRPNSTKIKSAKTFLKAFLRKFIPSKYTRYTVFHKTLGLMLYLLMKFMHQMHLLVYINCDLLFTGFLPLGGVPARPLSDTDL